MMEYALWTKSRSRCCSSEEVKYYEWHYGCHCSSLQTRKAQYYSNKQLGLPFFVAGSDAYGILNQERIGWVTNESVPQFGYKDNENNATVWPNGFPPDGTTIFIQKFIHNSTIVVFFLFAAAGIVFAIVCFTFTCAFRKRK